MTEHDEEFEGEEAEEGEEDTSELEAEFKAHWEKHEARIQKHVDAAARELQKAVEIADKEGIPFYASVSFLGQNYTPAVLEKFADLEQDVIDDITGTYNEYGGEGWQHSDVC
jgi:tRNA(Met) C34 N-acetyltransferase TmcA